MKLIERLDRSFEIRALTYSWDFEMAEAYPKLRAVALAAIAQRESRERFVKMMLETDSTPKQLMDDHDATGASEANDAMRLALDALDKP